MSRNCSPCRARPGSARSGRCRASGRCASTRDRATSSASAASAASAGPSNDTVKCDPTACCMRSCSSASRRQRSSVARASVIVGAVGDQRSRRCASRSSGSPMRYCIWPSSARACVSFGSSASARSNSSRASASRRSSAAAMPAPRCSRGFFGSAASAVAKRVGGGVRLSGVERRPGARARASAARGSICARERCGADSERRERQKPARLRSNAIIRRPARHHISHRSATPMLFLRCFTLMPQPASAPIEDGVIDVLKNVSRRPIEPTLDSDLVADLGFDSLQVLEVIAELEDRFDISIPLNDVPATRTVAQVVAQVARLVDGRGRRPDGRRCARCPRRWPTRRAPTPATASSAGDVERAAVVRRACTQAARASRARSRAPASAAAISSRSSCPTPKQFLTALFGASIAGVIPASLYPPATTGDLPRYLELTAAILRAARRPRRRHHARAGARVRGDARELSRPGAGALRASDFDGAAVEPRAAPSLDDIAFVQFTSGSTSAPKGVALTHAQPRGEHRRVHRTVGGRARRADDVGVSWLPLNHDMGLVGMALGAVYTGAPLRADDAADVRQAAGRMAARDHAAPRHGQLRAELRLRPVRAARQGSDRRARSVELARCRLRRRADSPADARRVRRKVRAGRVPRHELSPLLRARRARARRDVSAARPASADRRRRRRTISTERRVAVPHDGDGAVGRARQLRIGAAGAPAPDRRTTTARRCPSGTSARSCSPARR